MNFHPVSGNPNIPSGHGFSIVLKTMTLTWQKKPLKLSKRISLRKERKVWVLLPNPAGQFSLHPEIDIKEEGVIPFLLEMTAENFGPKPSLFFCRGPAELCQPQDYSDSARGLTYRTGADFGRPFGDKKKRLG